MRVLRVNVILDDGCRGMCYIRAMAHQSDTELLAQRLEAIQAARADIKRRDDELSADEQRIRLALDVIKSVKASLGQATEDRLPIQLAAHAVVATSASATLTTALSVQPAPNPAQPKQRLEDLILQALEAKDGVTSLEVVSMVELVSDAKRESIMSTLSRMASKGKVRRDGRLYFLVKKGESPEVVATTGLSVATESVAGQHTSSAPVGEEGEEL